MIGDMGFRDAFSRPMHAISLLVETTQLRSTTSHLQIDFRSSESTDNVVLVQPDLVWCGSLDCIAD